ncbi:uncharacterized protein TrAFT101_001174 [Trichoderma asperellum]|uniref:uncharacterized protein n=1 Tax=Trichoderma asperellum TaxID=101201 RepID=UPI0033339ECF|nr:hypothetical protein TrAFT101_001174 [Trichoderma asperellum]
MQPNGSSRQSDLADKPTLASTPRSGDLSYPVSFIHFSYSVLNTAAFDPLLFAATRRRSCLMTMSSTCVCKPPIPTQPNLVILSLFSLLALLCHMHADRI